MTNALVGTAILGVAMSASAPPTTDYQGNPTGYTPTFYRVQNNVATEVTPAIYDPCLGRAYFDTRGWPTGPTQIHMKGWLYSTRERHDARTAKAAYLAVKNGPASGWYRIGDAVNWQLMTYAVGASNEDNYFTWPWADTPADFDLMADPPGGSLTQGIPGTERWKFGASVQPVEGCVETVNLYLGYGFHFAKCFNMFEFIPAARWPADAIKAANINIDCAGGVRKRTNLDYVRNGSDPPVETETELPFEIMIRCYEIEVDDDGVVTSMTERGTSTNFTLNDVLIDGVHHWRKTCSVTEHVKAVTANPPIGNKRVWFVVMAKDSDSLVNPPVAATDYLKYVTVANGTASGGLWQEFHYEATSTFFGDMSATDLYIQADTDYIMEHMSAWPMGHEGHFEGRNLMP